ncbi:helix-turn-helix domain-containing GNAT family N-acetyltransferase [Cohaesibacter celericrescens]|uniref:helix-turn-helix domain-containing GNAT family N-acetyltransferase n=1 Tax=Cohaesibacter celericrescens TaxID=2067669 RepID=UPI001AEC77B2|nr:helix-turn-helix domain-containing GNAT family N-acetyltransferase [Cohaesibacter celericrescens]
MSNIVSIDQLDQIRKSSRIIVRELGFLKKGLAGTGLSPSAVHAIIEIGNQSTLRASDLRVLLGLEKSTISRLLMKLEEKGLLIATRANSDPRNKDLALTPKGMELFDDIEAFGRGQVKTALANLPEDEQHLISQGLATYADALKNRISSPQQAPSLQIPAFHIQSGYSPGLLARVTEMHIQYYSTNFGFGSVFECKVASGMAAFMERLSNPVNITLYAKIDERIVGAISVDGEDLGPHIAHLRWFILDDAARGKGIGTVLMKEAMAHIKKHKFSESRLWTFKGLEPARHLYEKFGFVLEKEWLGKQWGPEVNEQIFVRKHANS